MNGAGEPRTLGLRELLGRPVAAADGTPLGRVFEVVAEGEGDELRVAALRVGRGALLARLGTGGRAGRTVPWERVAELSPRITLRADDAGGG